MASNVGRQYARIRISIADDEDFEALSMAAQWLYMRVLIPEPTLNQAGVADWRPKRLLMKADGLTLAQILAAAAELERTRFALFDLDTEEVLVRSYIRSDELLRNPKMAASVVKAYRAVASRTLRAAIVTEVLRDRQDHPDYSSWTHKDTTDDLARLMARPALDTVDYTNQIADPEPVENTNRITNPNTNRNGNPDPVPNTDGNTDPVPDADDQSNSVRIPCSLQPAPLSLQPESGYVTGERHQSAGSGEPPTPNCPKHPNGTDAPCHACGAARTARQAWDREQARLAAEARSAEIRQRAELRAAEIAACALCDPEGYLGTRLCDHDPDTAQRAARGLALARAALAKPTPEETPDA